VVVAVAGVAGFTGILCSALSHLVPSLATVAVVMSSVGLF